MITRRTSFVVPAALVALTSKSWAQQARWDMPTPYADGNLHTRNIRQFVEEIQQSTSGRLAITVHSNASLLRLPEIRRGVQTGQVQMGETLVSTLANEDKMFGFDSVPGLATSYEAARRLYNAARPFLERRFERQGILMLYSVAWPPQGIFATRELNSLNDLRGSKFRAYNPQTARFAQLMGASPVTVQASEIAQAFRTGVADSMITSGATGVDTQAWDYLSHYYDLAAFLPQNVVLVNKAAFDALPADVRQAVQAAARTAEERGWKMSADLNDTLKKTMSDRGMKVFPPPAQMVADIQRIGQIMATEWVEATGADGAAVLAAYRR